MDRQKLQTYRDKRDFAKTSEPRGPVEVGGHRFVVLAGDDTTNYSPKEWIE